ncbi:hypothetical protein PIB30_014348 [Stylosanthes scabra]|uniref:Uncharacterized protein n=1 Tax=Stylosanthes scabra TaxID=79078 RepID=A0ABU6S6F3_9FABA|nr:hypothetical protein [Stylosanthes scabra]
MNEEDGDSNSNVDGGEEKKARWSKIVGGRNAPLSFWSLNVFRNYKEKKLGAKHNLKKEEELKNQGIFEDGTALRPRLGVGFHHSPRLGVAGKPRARQNQVQTWAQRESNPMTAPHSSCNSINLRGNDTLLTLYYLIRSGALAGGSLRFRKDFGHQVFGAVAGERTQVTRMTGGNTHHYTTTTRVWGRVGVTLRRENGVVDARGREATLWGG